MEQVFHMERALVCLLDKALDDQHALSLGSGRFFQLDIYFSGRQWGNYENKHKLTAYSRRRTEKNLTGDQCGLELLLDNEPMCEKSSKFGKSESFGITSEFYETVHYPISRLLPSFLLGMELKWAKNNTFSTIHLYRRENFFFSGRLVDLYLDKGLCMEHGLPSRPGMVGERIL